MRSHDVGCGSVMIFWHPTSWVLLRVRQQGSLIISVLSFLLSSTQPKSLRRWCHREILLPASPSSSSCGVHDGAFCFRPGAATGIEALTCGQATVDLT